MFEQNTTIKRIKFYFVNKFIRKNINIIILYNYLKACTDNKSLTKNSLQIYFFKIPFILILNS